MKLFFKNELIEFYCEPALFGVIPEPVPAYKIMPEWFKKIPVDIDARDMFGVRSLTAKKCMPLLDVMSMGFIIPLFGDVNLRVNKDGKLYEAGSNSLGNPIEFHPVDQLGGASSPTYPGPAIKFINKWVIKTAPGYSTLFMPPVNRLEPRFTCLSGLVDTDKYPKEVNFPAIWHMKDFDGKLEAGTPLVTVIPIRRKDLPRSAPIRKMTEKEFNDIDLIRKIQSSRTGYYTNELREPKK